MKHVVSFSGGRTSAYLVHLMEQRRLNDGWDVHYVFMDTGAEHPLTYKFIRDVVKFWDVPLTIIRVKFNPELGKGNSYEVFTAEDLMTERMPPLTPFVEMAKKHGTPTVMGAWCTSRMKQEPHDKWCDDTFGKGNYITWIGIRADEKRRLKEKIGIRYLAELSDFDKQDVIDWWKSQPFDLQIPEHLGNCVFCVKKSIKKIALACIDEPGLMAQFKSLCIDADYVRDGHRVTPKEVMYRGHLSLDGIAKMHASISRDDVYGEMVASKRFDTGSCSESCEIFSGENYDMFET